jgi:CheY-like chemotaxis protein
MTRIVYVVEDDPLQGEYLDRLLRDKFSSSLKVKLIGSESEFYTRFEEIVADKPACVIMDILLQWAPAEIAKDSKDLGSYVNAGLRCQKKLAEDPRTREIPVIFFTVLDRADVPELPRDTAYVRKDASDQRFVGVVRDVTNRRGWSTSTG